MVNNVIRSAPSIKCGSGDYPQISTVVAVRRLNEDAYNDRLACPPDEAVRVTS
jgi:hypothetical protein